MRPSSKTVVQKQFNSGNSLPADFVLSEVDAAIRDKGYEVIFEKAYMCPCKSKESTHLNTCKNCGGTGWLFMNPLRTRFIITGISADNKLKEAALREWGFIDSGVVNITAQSDDKFSFMDRVTIIDGTAEHSQILYPALTNDETQLFAYTKYDIKSIDYVALYLGPDQELQRLIETTDYTFRDNIILLDSQYNALENSSITVRYIHNPVFHIIDIVRESMTSYKGTVPLGNQRILLPIKAIAKRAHLIKDVENFDGDRLFDNSWKPNTCEAPELTQFQRQIRYTDVETIYNNMTASQKAELALLIAADDTILGVNGGVLKIEP